MKFLAIIVALLIERFWSGVQSFRRHDWFKQYCQAVRRGYGGSTFFDGWFGVIGMLVVPFFVVSWIQSATDEGSAVLIGLLFGIFVLVACIGPRDLGARFKAYVTYCERGESSQVDDAARELLSSDVLPAFVDERNARVLKAVLAGVNDWLPAVLFWFAVAGPVGALLFRAAWVINDCCEQTNEESRFAHAARHLHAALAWLPLRLTAFGFAVAGDMSGALRGWREATHDVGLPWEQRQRRLLVAAGRGALHIVDNETITSAHLRAALQLLQRTLITWLVAIALLTLMGFVR